MQLKRCEKKSIILFDFSYRPDTRRSGFSTQHCFKVIREKVKGVSDRLTGKK